MQPFLSIAMVMLLACFMVGAAVSEAQLLLRVEEAARRLAVGRSTLHLAVRRGEIESVKIGSARRIPAAALEAYVAKLRDQNAPTASE